MKSTNAIWVGGIATALIVPLGSARADDTSGAQQTQQTQQTHETQYPTGHKTKTTTTTTTTTTPSKNKAKETDQSGAGKADKGDKTSQSDKNTGTVESVTKDTGEAARKANESVVGPKVSRSNDEIARDPKLRPKDNREAKKAGEAVGRATTTAAEGVASVVQDTTRATDAPGPYSPFTLSWSPLGLIVGGRVSIQGEWVPTTHHVILLSPHFVHTSQDVATSTDTTVSQTFTGVGAELGYRYYTGHRGTNGVFIGPSVIGGVYNGSLPNDSHVFTDIGGALDVGFKGIIANHLAIGGGVGIEYLHVSHDFGDLSTAPAAIAASGVKPRLLFELGYGF